MPKQQWAEPQADWLPLRQAVFSFGVATEDVNLEKSLGRLTDAEQASPMFYSVWQLEEILTEKSGAAEAKIDPTDATFSFVFKDEFKEFAAGGSPWVILHEQTSAEPLDDEEGFIRIGAKEAARLNQRYQAIHGATGLVWRQFMLRAFDRAVSTKAVVLYARTPTLVSDFEQLPADVWAHLDVTDWQNGTAIAPDGTVYWSLMGSQPAAMAGSDDAAAKAVGAMIGPKPGEETEKRKQCEQALEIMKGGSVPRGHGYVAEIARQVKANLKSTYRQNSIEKNIRKTVREWERKNPA